MNSYNNRFGIQLFTARKMLMEIRILLTLFKVEQRREKWALELPRELSIPRQPCARYPNPDPRHEHPHALQDLACTSFLAHVHQYGNHVGLCFPGTFIPHLPL